VLVLKLRDIAAGAAGAVGQERRLLERIASGDYGRIIAPIVCVSHSERVGALLDYGLGSTLCVGTRSHNGSKPYLWVEARNGRPNVHVWCERGRHPVLVTRDALRTATAEYRSGRRPKNLVGMEFPRT
jgi:hypothetical protein